MESIYAKSRDNARTPMQWDNGTHAGFTDGTPWMKVNPNYKEINAAAQVGVPGSVFAYYQRLVALRKEYPVLTDGRFLMLMEKDEQVFAYVRENEQCRLLVICNFFGNSVECALTEEWEQETLLIGNYEDREAGVLKPYEARMYLAYAKNSRSVIS